MTRPVVVVGMCPGPGLFASEAWERCPPDARPVLARRLALTGKVGTKLVQLSGAPTEAAFRRRFECRNLLDFDARPWSRWRGTALTEAARFTAEFVAEPRYVVLLGLDVAEAFGHRGADFHAWVDAGGYPLAVAPHPSGLNRWYNDLDNYREAERFWRETWRAAL